MRAIVQDRIGGPEVLRLTDVERPDPLPTEVLVRVHAAGVNPVDWKTRAGGGSAGVLGEPPFVLGWDVSGVVAEVGRGVTRFAPGEEVFGMPWFPRQAGAYAEYVTAPSRQFAAKPASLDHHHAAALPLAGLTAWQSLVDLGRLQAGQRFLVHAAAGGVGHLAVQIAKARGAQVLGTARADNHPFLREIGVDQPIDYETVPFEEQAGDVDLVLDAIGGPDYGLRSLATMRVGGLIVQLAGGLADEVAAAAREQGKRATGFLVEPDYAGLEGIARLADAGRLRPQLQAVIPLADARRAHELGELGHNRGAIVLEVGQGSISPGLTPAAAVPAPG